MIAVPPQAHGLGGPSRTDEAGISSNEYRNSRTDLSANIWVFLFVSVTFDSTVYHWFLYDLRCTAKIDQAALFRSSEFKDFVPLVIIFFDNLICPAVKILVGSSLICICICINANRYQV